MQSEKIQSINNEGWEGVDATVKKVVNSQPSALDRSFARCFQTDDGKKVLQYLTSKTLDQPAWLPEFAPEYGYSREGQNSIVREINNRIRRATNE